MSKLNPREASRAKRKARFKRKLAKTKTNHPRLVVFKSNRFMYAQVIDDQKGTVLCQANSREKELASGLKSKGNLDAATSVGKLVAERLLKKNAEAKDVVFDRNGYVYHGKVKALADAAREAGLKF